METFPGACRDKDAWTWNRRGSCRQRSALGESNIREEGKRCWKITEPSQLLLWEGGSAFMRQKYRDHLYSAHLALAAHTWLWLCTIALASSIPCSEPSPPGNWFLGFHGKRHPQLPKRSIFLKEVSLWPWNDSPP